MAQSVAVVRNTLPTSGTVDFTSSGFGTPSAALIVVSNANTTNNPSSNAALSIGFWDGTNQFQYAVTSDDNVATTNENRYYDNDLFCRVGSSAAGGFTVANITDGIRLTATGTISVQYYATVILLTGVSASAFTFTPSSTLNGTATKTGLSFAPKLLLFLCGGDTTADGTAQHSIMSFGIARQSDGAQYMWSQGHQDALTTSVNTMLFSTTRCVGQTFSGSSSWTGEVTAWTSDGFTMTTRTAGSGGDVCACLALGGADLSFDMGTIATPTSTGTSATTTTVPPEALLLVASNCASTSVETDSDAEGIAIGMADDTNEYCHGIVVNDGASTTGADGYASATEVMKVQTSISNTATDQVVAAVSAFGSTSFTLNYTTVDASARYAWWLVFGTAATGFQPAWARYTNSIIGAGVAG